MLIQLFLDTHEHDDSNNKKAEEVDFFADCESDLNGFSQNNNNDVSTSAANETKVMYKCTLLCTARFSLLSIHARAITRY